LKEFLQRPHPNSDTTVEAVIAADPDDDQVLACAVAAKARWLVSGDAHLLALKHYKRIAFLTPTVAARRLPRMRRVRRPPATA